MFKKLETSLVGQAATVNSKCRITQSEYQNP